MNPLARILVVGGENGACKEALALLQRAGFDDVHVCPNLALDPGMEAPELLILVGAQVEDMCRDARRLSWLSHVPMVVFMDRDEPGHARAVRTLDAGADDVILPEIPIEITGARLRRLMAQGRERRHAAELGQLQEAIYDVHSVCAKKGTSAEALREILLIAAEVMDFERASLIAHIESSPSAYVIAATDDPSLSQFVISIDNYPELARVLESQEPVLLEDARSDPITAPVASLLAEIDVRGVALFPAIWQDASVGAVMFRKSRPGVGHLGEAQMMFARTFAAHAAACLQHGRVLESLRERTPYRLSRARYEAERRLRTIESLKEHFEAAADGVLVLDHQGRILFVNHAAESTIGFARDGLLGTSVDALVPETERQAVHRVIEQVLRGQNLEAFDLSLVTTSGETICASVTTSTVLGQSGAAVLSFRDVTAQRSLEAELRQTKEFLEKLVDSTVDGIVAADLRGNVIIFNQGAERIYGYTADEVIGNLSVWKLYAEGVPRQVMRMLRSTQYGGVGRLEQTRREILSKSGELVPVNITASIIYQDGREVATVGIFSDLRERIRIEQRLLQAQEKLQITEKQALVAELAGTAAHELNQPLTSIMGYAQLIQRQSDPEAPHQRALEIIVREAERMAEIVKKIGRITKYETKEYVGSTRMLDLERSARATTHEAGDGHGAQPNHGYGPDDIDDFFETEVTTQVQLADLVPHIEGHHAAPGAPASGSDDDSESDTQDEALR